ncbi:saccharopine dehydrogenase NADP-binding domain-containing protein [Nocardia sp. NBC_00508]|uniref:saccharopine dehydrogenase family protein n=1 Tax=Nocardia sp. NBC_00508 TaxID=2975992 RepID=UPI002E80C9B4|nr:saccharopine dehydrogenase NADP-binding domain-containing protein [Nocardia sp. NBC_00508]WUD66305.1 saccharopine dehydrogenase NADP-binding domain-containing protein [Nocardia sp. NBC_00508]
MPAVVVYGAYGHTGRFIVAELVRRGWTPILSGRDEARLRALAATHPGLDVRPAAVDDPNALDRVLRGGIAVVNAAGPFARTAHAVAESALRTGTHYLDVAAEVEVAHEIVTRYPDRARSAGIVIAPSIAFYGGLGDLLATAAMGGWSSADRITLAYALDSWIPTLGTRATVATSKTRRDGRRLVFSGGRFVHRTDAAPVLDWTYPAPVGKQTVVGEFTTADSVTIPHHLDTAVLDTYMTAAPLRDLSAPDLTPPQPADDTGRSAQQFLVEVVAHANGAERRAVAAGRDIYAATAPIIAEVLTRIHSGNAVGVLTAGRIADAPELLRALHPAHFDRLDLGEQ